MSKSVYNKLFRKTRVSTGAIVSTAELAKRVAYELQIPKDLSPRVLKTVLTVISDALLHGECIQIPSVGKFELLRSDTAYKERVTFNMSDDNLTILHKNIKKREESDNV